MCNCCTVYNFLDSILNNNVFVVIVGTLLAGWFGFKKYKSQRVWENIEKRYFQEGIENLISYFHHLRYTIEDNFENCTRVIKYFRDLGYKDFLQWFDISQKSISERTLSSKVPPSFFIVSPKIKNEHFNKLCLAIFAEIAGINDYYISDIITGLLKIAREPKSAKLSKEEVVKKAISEGEKIYKHLHKDLGLYDIIEILEEVLFELRKMNIGSYKKLEKSFENPKIIRSFKKLEKYKLET